MAKKKRRGRTLWEMLVDWAAGTMEMRHYNPLRARVGSFVNFTELDLRDLDFKVVELREYRRRIAGRSFVFVDYVLEAKPLKEKEVTARLRLNPVADPKKAGGRTHDAIYLTLYDEMAYEKEFEKVLRDRSGVFKIEEDGEVKEQFWRINDVKNSYRATVSILRDLDEDGKVVSDEVEEIEIEYWDFWRDTRTEVELPVTEFLFVEMDKKTGWFQLWRGRPIDQEKALVV